jgi:type IV secretory pathway VirB2 component (pilin)
MLPFYLPYFAFAIAIVATVACTLGYRETKNVWTLRLAIINGALVLFWIARFMGLLG